MVYLKVSDGFETRKFQVTPGEVTFDQLEEKLTSVFPSSVKSDSKLTLQYRDSDGDVITLSSDGELQEALSGLPDESVWKLQIKKSAATKSHKTPPSQCGRSPFDIFFEPRGPNLWGHFDQQFQEAESLIQQLWCKAKDDKETNENSEKETVHPKGDSTSSEEGKADLQTESTKSEADDETVKSKLSEDNSSSEGTSPTSKQHPTCHSKTVVSWEPQLCHTLFGPRTVLRPVRYNVVYWGKPESNDKTKKSESGAKPAAQEEKNPEN